MTKNQLIENILEDHLYSKILIKGVHDKFYLYVFDKDGNSHVLLNKHGASRGYSHIEQIMAWLNNKFYIYDIEVDTKNWVPPGNKK